MPPADPVQDNVLVPDVPKVMLLGLREHVNPAGDEVDVRETVPVNPPLTDVTVIVEVATAPVFVLTLVGLAVIVKSGEMIVMASEWARVPLVPVTVTV